MDNTINVGIVGLGVYLPAKKMTAAEVSAATGGIWSEDAVPGVGGAGRSGLPEEHRGRPA